MVLTRRSASEELLFLEMVAVNDSFGESATPD